MGLKDDYQFDYPDDNERFADQINGALFNGEQVVKSEEPEAVANIRISEKFKTIKDGKELYNMCKAFDDMRQEGYDEGKRDGKRAGRKAGKKEERKEGIRILIQTVKNLGASKLAACEQLIQQYALKESEANEKIEMYWGN